MTTLLSVVGARPNFMKVAPLHRALAPLRDRVRHVIVHTGQHYDEKMSKVFFDDLELPPPDVYLGVGSGSHAEQTARVMTAFERTLADIRPDRVIVVGDVNSTLACSLTAVKLGVPVAHVEAGLRSGDRSMPEEINRLVTDTLSDLLFVTERAGRENLLREGVEPVKIHFVGHVMIDSLEQYRARARSSKALADFALEPGRFALVTLHRPGNVDDPGSLEKILRVFDALEKDIRIVFPVHPRTRQRLGDFGLAERFSALPGLTLCDPLGYLDFLALLQESMLVLTDSGGIQEETTYLRIPCLTLRENTERPVTVEVGSNELVGLDVERIIALAREAIAGRGKRGAIPELWDGHAGERIVDILLKEHRA